MAADIFFRREDYQNAANYYETAVTYNPENADVYRDYAISLARIGNAEKSEEILQIAIEYGLTEDGIYMVTGEIQFIREEYPEAVESLKKGIAITPNDNLKRNAYLLCSRAYKEQYGNNDERLILENITLLEEALTNLPQEMLMQVREYLAQAYIDYGELTSRDDYFAKAITLLQEIKYNDDINSYQTDMNLAVLCDKIGNTLAAKELLLEMAAEPEYEIYYYTIYLRLAYCEANIQGKLDVSGRDYTEFDRYYQETVKQYEIYTESGNSDPEMDKLKQLRNEMVSLGWLK